MHVRWWLGRRSQDPIQPESRQEAGAACFEMDVARAGIVGVAHQQIDIPDDRRLVGEIANIRREVVVAAVGARELDCPLGARSQTLDEPIHFTGRGAFDGNFAPVCEGDVVDSREQCVWRGGNHHNAFSGYCSRAKAMMEQILPGQTVSQREFGHRMRHGALICRTS